MLVLLLGAVDPVAAEVWGYVDAAGRSHLAGTRVDDRYRLFFRGDVVSPEARAAVMPAATAAAAEPGVDGAPAGPYDELIRRHAVRHALDPVLVKAMIAVESAFQPAAVSPKGARGLMQVLPETAARYGVRADGKGSAEQKLLDPAINLGVGTRYLADLLVRFADDVPLALAAYNAGEMAVVRYRNQVPPYRETVAYVKQVLALAAAWRPVPPPPAVAPAPRLRLHGTLLNLPEGAAAASADP